MFHIWQGDTCFDWYVTHQDRKHVREIGEQTQAMEEGLV